MSKTATDIVKRALTLLDEQLPSFTQAASTEMSLSAMAFDILPTVARNLVKELPYNLKKHLPKSLPLLPVESLQDGENQSVYNPTEKRKVAFILPSDFWELISIKLKYWAKPVTEYIMVDSPEYAKQHNPFTRAGNYNPVVAISQARDGSDRLECFSVNVLEPVWVDYFYYVSFDNVPNDTDNPWPDELFDHITKALAMELNTIKGRIAESGIREKETENVIEQHK